MDNKFNFLYLRAKAIMQDEKAARALVQEVDYEIQQDDLLEDGLYEIWGKTVYSLGCGQFREKKEREAESLELREADVTAIPDELSEEQKETLESILEKLPDLYFATVMAFYYDYMSVEEVAKVMNCTVQAVQYRLNYARKCIEEELPEQVDFSVDVMRSTILTWMKEQAQNLDEEPCKQSAMKRSREEWAGLLTFLPPLQEKKVVKIVEPVEPEVIEQEVEEPEEPEVEESEEPVTEEAAEEVEETPEVEEETEVEETVVEEEPEVVQEEPQEKKKGKGWFWVAGIILILGVGAWAVTGPMKKEDNKAVVSGTNDVKQESQQAEQTQEPEVQEPEVQEPVTEEPETQEPEVQKDSTYLFADSDKVALKESQLRDCTKAQLRLARNEIYARYGVIFGVEDLDEYFGNKSWYTPKMSITEFYEQVEMNMIEEKNVALIQKIEQEK